MIYIVTYDLFGPPERYSAFFDTLKKQGDSWSHYLRNTWLISTYKAPQQIFDDIKGQIAANDRILIVRFQSPYQGWLPKEAWDWIHKYEHASGFPQGSTGNLFKPETGSPVSSPTQTSKLG